MQLPNLAEECRGIGAQSRAAANRSHGFQSTLNNTTTNLTTTVFYRASKRLKSSVDSKTGWTFNATIMGIICSTQTLNCLLVTAVLREPHAAFQAAKSIHKQGTMAKPRPAVRRVSERVYDLPGVGCSVSWPRRCRSLGPLRLAETAVFACLRHGASWPCFIAKACRRGVTEGLLV